MGAETSWVEELPLVLLALRVSPRTEDDLSPAERVFGTPTSVPSDFSDERSPEPESYSSVLQLAISNTPPPPIVHGQTPSVYVAPKLLRAKYVYVRRDGVKKPLSRMYEGPFRVVKRGKAYFTLKLGDQTDIVSLYRLKPVVGHKEVQEAVPAKRGRPRKNPTASTTRSVKEFSAPKVPVQRRLSNPTTVLNTSKSGK